MERLILYTVREEVNKPVVLFLAERGTTILSNTVCAGARDGKALLLLPNDSFNSGFWEEIDFILCGMWGGRGDVLNNASIKPRLYCFLATLSAKGD